MPFAGLVKSAPHTTSRVFHAAHTRKKVLQTQAEPESVLILAWTAGPILLQYHYYHLLLQMTPGKRSRAIATPPSQQEQQSIT